MKKCIAALVVAAGAIPAMAQYDILVIEQGGHPYGNQAIQDLKNLGHNVTVVQNPLNDYAGYDQVWDMRYATNMTNNDTTAMGAYLAAGGRMLVLGEHSGFEGSRNISLRQWISDVGAGQVGNYVQGCEFSTEDITAAGQIVNSPNTFMNIKYNCATTYNQKNITQGFLVTATANGDGGIIGWDYGDISGAADARMLAVWDIEVWETGVNGIKWTEDMATYLGGRVPAPGSMAVLGLAGVLAGRRRRA